MASPGMASCKNVSGTSAAFSRQMVLDWVNSTMNANYRKIEQLCDGVAYCTIMDQIFPGSVSMRRLVFDAKREEQYLDNLKILQLAFNRVKCDRPVPLDKLALGRFQDNWEFAQWFKQFVDANCGDEQLRALSEEARSLSLEHNIHKLPPKFRHSRSLSSGINPLATSKTSASPVSNSSNSSYSSVGSSSTTTVRNYSTPLGIALNSKTGVVLPRLRLSESSSVSSAAMREASMVKKQIEDLSKEKSELQSTETQITFHRDVYFLKLLKIEEICRAVGSDEAESEFCQKVMDIAYVED